MLCFWACSLCRLTHAAGAAIGLALLLLLLLLLMMMMMRLSNTSGKTRHCYAAFIADLCIVNH
jgi:hypothetical protein